MTPTFALTCCSTADLSAEHFAARDISYACFHYTLHGAEYLDDLGRTVPLDRFYREMVTDAETKTAQVNISEYLALFTPILESGKDILHICFSGGLSGTVNSARNAALIAREQFPDRKIYIVDSLAASSGFGLLMDRLADLRDEGMDIEAVRDWAEENRLRLNHWFFSTNLSYYVRGGRISRTAGFVGSLLGICPLLNMDGEGRLVPRYKIRSKKRVIREIVEQMERYADGGRDYSGKCYISHAGCPEDAAQVAALIEERFPKLDGRVGINWVGTTVGSHTGPGTVAVFFWGRSRTLPLLALTEEK